MQFPMPKYWNQTANPNEWGHGDGVHYILPSDRHILFDDASAVSNEAAAAAFQTEPWSTGKLVGRWRWETDCYFKDVPSRFAKDR